MSDVVGGTQEFEEPTQEERHAAIQSLAQALQPREGNIHSLEEAIAILHKLFNRVRNQKLKETLIDGVFRPYVVTALRRSGLSRLADEFQSTRMNCSKIRETISKEIQRSPEAPLSIELSRALEVLTSERLEELRTPVHRPAYKKEACQDNRPKCPKDERPRPIRVTPSHDRRAHHQGA